MSKKYLLPAAILLGVFWDFLFWKKSPGISYPIFIILCLATGFLLLRSSKVYPSRINYLLFGLIAIFSTLTFVRNDIFTRFVNFALSILFTSLLSVTYKSGAWVNFNLFDYIRIFFHFIVQIFALPLHLIFSEKSHKEGERRIERDSLALQICHGLLLALPALILLILLLSSADLIFAQRVTGFMQFFSIENLTDYFIQGMLILGSAYFFIGLIRYAEIHSLKNKRREGEQPIIQPFLGFTEGATILVSVIILFSIFVIIQFRYFFSGGLNINEAGFTYAEYARRGFGELILVAIFSLVLIQGVRSVLKFKNNQQRKFYIGLAIGLVLLVLVILTSSFQRLLLYESAYGFSNLRAYSHVFIIWLGLLLISIIILEIINQPQLFINATLFSMVGFVLSLNLLNVNAFIVMQNVKRADSGQGLDASYLASLSSDAIPSLVKEFNSSEHTSSIHAEIGVVLACHNHRMKIIQNNTRNNNWQSYHLANWRANKALSTVSTKLDPYRIVEIDDAIEIHGPNGFRLACKKYTGFD